MIVEAKKDGLGNVIITENSFEMLLACLDNQKFVCEAPQNGDSIAVGEEQYKQTQQSIQATIDEYNRASRDILHQKLLIDVDKEEKIFLIKKYELQEQYIPWNSDEIIKIKSLFNESFHIERNVFYGEVFLSISEDGKANRTWNDSEIYDIQKLFNL